MLDPHRLPHRLALVAGLSLLSVLVVPTAFAVEPMIEGGYGRSATADPPLLVDAAAGGFDWSAAFVLALSALVALGSLLALRDAAVRRGRRLATR